jgi:hypothetical protein
MLIKNGFQRILTWDEGQDAITIELGGALNLTQNLMLTVDILLRLIRLSEICDTYLIRQFLSLGLRSC